MDNLRVLIIDEGDNRTLCEQLQAHHHNVEVVGSQEALERHLARFPEHDVILVERNLPQKEGEVPEEVGIDLCKRLRNRYPWAEIRLYSAGDSAFFQMDEVATNEWIDKSREGHQIVHDVLEMGWSTALRKIDHYYKSTEQVAKIGHSLLDGSDEETVINTILTGIVAMGFDRARLAMPDRPGGDWVIREHVGHGENFDPRSAEWLHVAEFDQENPQPHLVNEADVVTYSYYYVQGKRSEIVPQRIEIPLVNMGKLIGVIAADTVLSGRHILRDEFAPLMAIATQAAVALSKTRLVKSEQRHLAQRQVLVDSTLEISRLEHSESIYHAGSRAIIKLFPNIEHSRLVIFSPDFAEGYIRAEYPNQDAVGKRISLADVVFLQKLIRDETYYVDIYDVEGEPELGQIGTVLAGFGVKSILIVPIRHEGQLLGSLSLDTLTKHHRFSPEKIEIAQILAAHVGAALVNAVRREKLDILSRISSEISITTQRDVVLRMIVEQAVELLNARSGGIALINHDRQGIEVVIDSHRTVKRSAFLRYGEGMAGYMLQEGLSYLTTEEYSRESYCSAIFEDDNPFGAMIMTALYWNREPIGFLYLDDVVGRKFNQHDVEDLKLFASYIANVVHQNELIHEKDQFVNAVVALHLIGDAIEGAENIERIAHFALNGITASYGLNCDLATLFLFDPEDESLGLQGYAAIGGVDFEDHHARIQYEQETIRDQDDYLTQYERHGFKTNALHQIVKNTLIPASDSASQKIIDWMKSLLEGRQANPENLVWEIADLTGVPAHLHSLLSDRHPIYIIALIANRKLTGLFFVQNPYSERPVKTDQKRALGTFATSTAVAIDKVRLLEKAHNDAERIGHLFELGNREFGDIMEREAFMQRIVEAVMEETGADGASLLRINPINSEVTRVFATGVYETNRLSLPSIRLDGHSMKVIETEEPFFISDTNKTEDYLNPSISELALRAVACLPAIAIGEKLGVIWLGYKKPRRFYKEELDAWQLFVNHAALTYRLTSNAQRLDAERNLVQNAAEIVVLARPEETYRDIVMGSQRALQANEVRLYLCGKRGDCPHIIGWKSVKEQEFVPLEIDDGHQRALSCLASKGEEVQYKATQSDETSGFPFADLFAKESGSLAFVAPLVFENRMYGALCVTFDRQEIFSESRRSAISRLQRFCAATLSNLDKLITARHQVIRLETLQKINVDKNKNISERELYGLVTGAICDALAKQNNAPFLCEVRLRDKDHLVVRELEVTPLAPPFDRQTAINKWHTRLLEETSEVCVTNRAFLHRKTVYVPDVTKDKHYVKTVDGVRSEVAVPIVWQEEYALGVLNVEHGGVDPFSQEDVDWLEAIAAHLAFGLIRLRQANQQRSFHAISKKIASAITKQREPPDLLRLIYEATQPMSNANILQILLHEVNDGHMKLVEAYPKPLEVQEIDLNSDMPIGIAGRCAKMRKSQIAANVKKDPDYIPLYPQTLSKIAVPMFYEGDLIAVLSLHSDQPAAFMVEDKILLETFAELAAIVRYIY